MSFADMRIIFLLDNADSLSGGLTLQIEELQDRQEEIRMNKKNYYNWELTFNRIELQIRKLRNQRRIALILES